MQQDRDPKSSRKSTTVNQLLQWFKVQTLSRPKFLKGDVKDRQLLLKNSDLILFFYCNYQCFMISKMTWKIPIIFRLLKQKQIK